MSLKLIETFTVDNRTVKVYRDSDWQEYIARLFVDGKENKEAAYHANDRGDALTTGEAMATNR